MAEVKLKFSADTASVQKGISKVESSISKLKGVAGGLTKAFTSVILPVTALGGLLGGIGIGAAVKDVLDYGGALSDLSNITDIAISDLVVLQEEFRQAGIDVGSLEKVMGKLGSSISQPSPKVLDWLTAMKLSMDDLKGKSLSQQFNIIGTGIAGLSNTTDKMAASQAFFGKSLGTSLINLFKTKTAVQDAKEYVGQLGETMEKNANAFDRVSDIIAGANIKVRQFFASFVGANIDRLTEISDAFAKLDLTNIGKSFGETADKIIDTLIAAFKQGRLWETLWNGFSATLKKTGELLVSIFEYAAQRLARTIEDSLRGTKLGGYLGIQEDQTQTYTNSKGEKTTFVIRDYQTKNPEDLSKIIERNKNIFGGEDSIKAFFDPLVKANENKVDKPVEPPAIDTSVIDALNNSVMEAMLGSTYDVLTTGKGISRFKPQDDSKIKDDPYKPILSSLARIGGTSAFTNNPLITIQKRANILLETIALNTSKTQKSPLPSWA